MSVVEKNKESVESFLSGKLSRVDVGAIQAELRRLWLEAATSNHDEPDHPQISRACSCNLVLFTDDEDAQTAQGNVLDSIVLRNPARAILTILNNDASKGKRLEAWVSARCHMGSGARQICSEQITVVADNPLEEELISVIDSLVLGDQPTFVWWTLCDLNGDVVGPYLGCARRFIVDSGQAPYSFQFMSNLNNIVESVGDCIGVSDLNWSRLLGIRRALAEEFERAPFTPESLEKIVEVTISSNGQELQSDDCSVQGLLLTGWLASRLGWTPTTFARESDQAHSRARFNRKDGKDVNVEFHSMPFNDVIPGAVYHVVVKMEDGHSVEVYRDPAVELSSLVVLVRKDGTRTRELIAEEAPLDVVALMCAELDELTGDKVFAESLETAFDLIQLACEPA